MEQGFLKPEEILELINLAENIIWQVNNPVVITLTLFNEDDKGTYTFSNLEEYLEGVINA